MREPECNFYGENDARFAGWASRARIQALAEALLNCNAPGDLTNRLTAHGEGRLGRHP